MTDQLSVATRRLLSTVDHLEDTEWSAPSVCLGWSRAHVVAHLALNAEALGGVVRRLLEGTPTTMYGSNDARAADIETLAAAPPDRIRDRLRSAATFFSDAVSGVASLPDGTTFERTPGGLVMVAAHVPGLRLREVEIHHADLAAGYSHADWRPETVVAFLDRDAAGYDGAGFVARATDLGREWAFGSPTVGAPVVSGPASALAWWATGRPVPDHGSGPVLSSTTGTLPTLEGR